MILPDIQKKWGELREETTRNCSLIKLSEDLPIGMQQMAQHQWTSEIAGHLPWVLGKMGADTISALETTEVTGILDLHLQYSFFRDKIVDVFSNCLPQDSFGHTFTRVSREIIAFASAVLPNHRLHSITAESRTVGHRDMLRAAYWHTDSIREPNVSASVMIMFRSSYQAQFLRRAALGPYPDIFDSRGHIIPERVQERGYPIWFDSRGHIIPERVQERGYPIWQPMPGEIVLCATERTFGTIHRSYYPSPEEPAKRTTFGRWFFVPTN